MLQIAALLPPMGRPLLVAVDGVDGSGKTWFADELAAVIGRQRPVVRAAIDDFHFPRAHRHAHGRTSQAVWERHFDYRALRRELIDPWRRGVGATYQRRWHDVSSDEYVATEQETVPEGGVLVVDGIFAQRSELSRAWDLVVFLDVPFAVSVPRMAERDGTSPDLDDPDQLRYQDAQRIYLESIDPRSQADVVVDNSDLMRPRVSDTTETPVGWELKGSVWCRTVETDAATARAINQMLNPDR